MKARNWTRCTINKLDVSIKNSNNRKAGRRATEGGAKRTRRLAGSRRRKVAWEELSVARKSTAPQRTRPALQQPAADRGDPGLSKHQPLCNRHQRGSMQIQSFLKVLTVLKQSICILLFYIGLAWSRERAGHFRRWVHPELSSADKRHGLDAGRRKFDKTGRRVDRSGIIWNCHRRSFDDERGEAQFNGQL